MSHRRFRAVVIGAAFILAAGVFWRLARPDFASIIPPLQAFTVAFFLPAAALGVTLLIRWISSGEPFQENYARFRGTFELLLDLTVVLIVGIQVTLHAFLLFYRAGRRGPLWLVPTTLISLIIIVTGNVLPRLRPNSTMGIRTPWALNDERNWIRIHRAGGYLLVFFGLALLVITFIDFQRVWWVAVPGLILTFIGLPLLSYILWRHDRRDRTGSPGSTAPGPESRPEP